MKIGIISDIHGNIKALDVVLKKLEEQEVDKIICLGDIACDTPFCEEVIQKIINLKEKIIVVMGNKEDYIINGLPETFHDEMFETTQEQRDRQEWINKQLSSNSLEYIKNLNKQMCIEVAGKKIFITHYPCDDSGKYKKHIFKPTVDECEELFIEFDADIYLYGHTHIQNYNENNNKIYINPGALGCPGKTNLAEYGIITIDNDKVAYEQFQEEYDVESMIRIIKEANYPGYEWILRLFYGMEVE